MTEYKITTCGECKAIATMRASGICKECEEAVKEIRFDGVDGF